MAWLRFLPHIGAAALAAFLAWQAAGLWHAGEITALKASHKLALDAKDTEKNNAITAERKACAANQAIAQGVSDDLQKKLRSADARHADTIHRLLAHEAAKRLPPAGAAGGRDAGAGANGFPGADSALVVSVIDGGRNAEKQAEQLTACQRFIRETWKANQP